MSKLGHEPQTLSDALEGVPPWVRLVIGLFVSGTVAVYVPLCFVALFGVWQNNLTMWGLNAVAIALFIIPNSVGRATSSVWWGSLVYMVLFCGYATKVMATKEPIRYWIVYWPLYFTIIAGSQINAACFVWFAESTGLSWKRTPRGVRKP